MAKVRATETKPEIFIRKSLFSVGLRFRKNVAGLPGKPDIVLPKYKCVVFVHGCFWHGHKNCKNYRLPKSQVEYWVNKISGNVKRDEKNKRLLKRLGFRVIIFWECQLRKKGHLTNLINKIRESR